MVQAVILAGGQGTRLSEDTGVIPKPMIRIGEKPILWHILKIYAAAGISDFIICCGYKGIAIKQYFRDYALNASAATISMQPNATRILHNDAEDWRVTLIDTGDSTMTGGRLARVIDLVSQDDYFHFTYGDCVSDIDIKALQEFHQKHGKLATVTAVSPPGRFGALGIDGQQVSSFAEKPAGDGAVINGGFFVLSPKIMPDYLPNDDACIWERQPLEKLAADGQLMAYNHQGFWHAMDTLHEKKALQNLWNAGSAPWKTW